MNAFLLAISFDMPTFAVAMEPFDETKQVQLGRQSALLETFFSKIRPKYMAERMGGQTMHEICEWRGFVAKFVIHCIDGFVNNISIEKVNQGNFLIEYLPSATEQIILRGCKQEYQLETRKLPKHMKCVYLKDNFLFGTIDFQHLPPQMDTLDVSNNAIEGPIILRDLPETMRSISIFDNSIAQDVLYYGYLPKTLTVVSLWGNSFRSIQRIDEAMPRRDIFYNRLGKREID